MRDEINHNALAVTGTPSLVTGALTVDTDQGLQFNGTTNSASATDSASLSITGSMSIECLVKLAAYPGSTKVLVGKAFSYNVWIDSTGHVVFSLENPTYTQVVSNVVLSLNTWYHIVCVYNGNYSGTPQFGKTTLGSDRAQVDDDNGNNKAVTKFTLAESALLRDMNVALLYADEVWPVQMRAVVYADNAGVPGALVTTSDVQVLNTPNPQWRVFTWVNFPLTPAVVPAGTYYIGYVADTTPAPVGKAPLVVSADLIGGASFQRQDSVSGPSDPFGAVSLTNTYIRSVYCNYTAVARTGFEGKALIYINGARNTTTAYTGGIADTANTLDICPSLAAQVDEVSIWNKALTGAQIATHYTAH